MRKIWVSVLLPLRVSVAVVFSFAAYKRAAGGVTVNLAFRESSSRTGEVVSLDVRFSSFPSITRFGPIEIGYDANALEFVGMDLGEDLEGFKLEKEQPEGEALIRFSAVNEEAEASIMQGATENEKKDPTSKPTDTEPVFLSSIKSAEASCRSSPLFTHTNADLYGTALPVVVS